MKKVWNFILAMSRPTFALLLASVVVIGFLTFKLGTLTPGISQPELQTYLSADSIGKIFDNSVNGPYKLAIFMLTSVSSSVFALRLVGSLVGIVTVGVFYLFVRRLMTPAIALATTFMFAASSMLLHSARLASPELMSLVLLSVVAIGFYLRFHKNNDIIWILSAPVIALSFYVPGMFFFVILAAGFQFRHLRKSFEQLKPATIIIASLLFSILLAPIVINLIREPNLWNAYLGLPETLPSFQAFISNLLNSTVSIFAYSEINPITHVGRQPVLDVFTLVLVIYGLIALARQYKLDRFWLIIGLLISGIIWVSLTNNFSNLILLLPFLYILAGIGLQKLTNQWTEVFPRNPIAKIISYSLIFITVALSINLHTQRYFNAWPNAPETKEAFSLQIPTE